MTDVQQFTGSLRVTGSGNHFIMGGNVGFGTIAPAGRVHAIGDVISQTSLNIAGQFWFNSRKSRGTVDSPTTVLVGDDAGGILFTGYDGSNWRSGAGIAAQVQSVSVGSLSSNLIFYAGNGSVNSATRVMVMRGDTQNVLVGTTTDPGYKVNVNGSGNFSSNLTATGSILFPSLTNANQVNVVGYNTATGQLFYQSTGSLSVTSASFAQTAVTSSYPISITGSTLYTTALNTGLGFSTSDSIFFGSGSGYQSINSSNSNFLGREAGYQTITAGDSNFFGYRAGYQATNTGGSNFLGREAGYQATNSSNANFIGNGAGKGATNAPYSTFLGSAAGFGAINAEASFFAGYNAGASATSASLSTLIGWQAGYNIAGGSAGVASNNIIIGTNITLGDGRKDSINLGGVIFATGSYSNTSTNPYSGSVGNGRVGINVVNPVYNLDVSGSGNFTSNLTATGSVRFPGLTNVNQTNIVSYNTTTGQLFYQTTSSLSVATASYALTASHGPSGFTIGITQIKTATVNSSIVGSNNLFTDFTGSFSGAKYLYTVSNGSNARTGEVMAVWNGGSVQYTDNSTLDIGSTTAVTASVSIVGTDALFNMQTNTSGWRIKSQVTYI